MRILDTVTAKKRITLIHYRFKTVLFISLTILLASACSFCSAEETGSVDARCKIEPRTQDNDNILKILLLYDMEGLAGQNIITSIDFPRPEYFEARKLLTDDVNAAIDGLFAGGADSVIVVDAHGSFNPDRDILLDKMDPRAKMLYRKERFDSYVDLLEDNTFDAIVGVGMHSRTGGGGFAEHTINLGMAWELNGMPLNESEIYAYSWGRIGVPLIFVSGDDKLNEQVSWMPWLQHVTVKEARGVDDALLYPVDEVHEKMRTVAQYAIENIDNAKVVTLTEPITATLRVVPPADLSVLEGVPGVHYDNQSETFQAADFKEAYNGMRALMRVAQSGYFDLAASMLFEQKNGFDKFKDRIFHSWQNKPGEEAVEEKPDDKQKETKPKLYFGSR